MHVVCCLKRQSYLYFLISMVVRYGREAFSSYIDDLSAY